VGKPQFATPDTDGLVLVGVVATRELHGALFANGDCFGEETT
jgi:hypothetical protein